MRPLKIVLILVVLVGAVVTETPFGKIKAKFGFVPDEVKAAQCLAVSRILPENDARIWSEAANEKIAYWLEHQSGCSTPRECVLRQNEVVNFAEQKAYPDGNNPSSDILNGWRKSDFCQGLVSMYMEKSRQGIRSKQEVTPQTQVQQAPQKTAQGNANLTGDEVDHSPDAEPNTSGDAVSKKSGKSWQDKNGFVHYPDGSISSSPVD